MDDHTPTAKWDVSADKVVGMVSALAPISPVTRLGSALLGSLVLFFGGAVVPATALGILLTANNEHELWYLACVMGPLLTCVLLCGLLVVRASFLESTTQRNVYWAIALASLVVAGLCAAYSLTALAVACVVLSLIHLPLFIDSHTKQQHNSVRLSVELHLARRHLRIGSDVFSLSEIDSAAVVEDSLVLDLVDGDCRFAKAVHAEDWAPLMHALSVALVAQPTSLEESRSKREMLAALDAARQEP